MLCLCHVHICTCELLWVVYTMRYMFVLKVWRKKACEKMFVLYVCELVWSEEGCGRMSNCEWTVCNGKCRWRDVKGSHNLPVDHLKCNEVNTGHRLWRSTLLYNPPPATQKEKTHTHIKSPTALGGNTHRPPENLNIHARLTVNVPDKCESVTEKEWEAALWRLRS